MAYVEAPEVQFDVGRGEAVTPAVTEQQVFATATPTLEEEVKPAEKVIAVAEAATPVLPEGIIKTPDEPALPPKPLINLASLKAAASTGDKKEEGKEPSKQGEALANLLGISLKKPGAAKASGGGCTSSHDEVKKISLGAEALRMMVIDKILKAQKKEIEMMEKKFNRCKIDEKKLEIFYEIQELKHR